MAYDIRTFLISSQKLCFGNLDQRGVAPKEAG